MDILKGDAKILATKKEIRGVIVPRHDTAINWSKAVNFTPENGELIIISADNATDVARGYYLDSEGNRLTSVTVNSNGVNKVCVIKPSDKVRFKFGNGKDNVNALPFQTEAIQGTASGTSILLDDVSPVTHEMSVKVRSKNILPYPYAETTKTLNGITITDSGDGSISLSGTSTAQVNFYFSQNLQLKKGITYTLSASGNYSFGGTAAFYIYNSTYGSLAYINLNADNSFTFTFTPTKDINGISCYIVIPSDRTVSGTLKPQLELGTTATAYTPYVDLTAVKVTRCGKNLLPYPYINSTRTINGITFTVNSDGSITANGTATSNAYLEITSISTFYIPKGNYILSGCPSGGSSTTYSLTAVNGSGASYTKLRQDIGNGITLSSSGEYWVIRCQVMAGQTVENIVFKPQIELGTTVTDYEPYKECVEYTPTADGTVEGVTSLYLNTTLMTDTDGVIIDCEYLTKSYTDILGSTNLRNGSAKGSIRSINSKAEDDTYTIGTNAFAEGTDTTASGRSSHAEGRTTEASGSASHAEGFTTAASGSISHAEGCDTTASGNYSHAEGCGTRASGLKSHAEGESTTALSNCSHTEGNNTTAGQMGFKVTACEKLTDTTGTYTLTSVTGLYKNQRYSVHSSSSKENCGKITAIDNTNKKITVDGYPDIALSTSSSSITNYLTIVNKPDLGDILISGDFSHAEGDSTKASGNVSHAEGGSTQASSDYQHVQGKYNIEDSNNIYADIIGNGSYDEIDRIETRSNAATVDWQGNAWYAGDVYVGSTSGTNRDDGSKKLATEEYTNNIINKKIEVSETAPTEEENKIWLQPMTTNVGAVDYIVEEGISGIWTYRKWNSGIAECWGYVTISVLCSNQSGNVYYSDFKRVALPDGLFTGATIANANCADVWCWVGPVSLSSTFVDLKISRGSSYDQAFNTGVYLSVKGRWK